MNLEEDDYVVQTLNTAAPPCTVAENDSKNFECRNLSQSCGWHKFHPKKLQRLNNPKWFLFFLIVFSIAQGKLVLILSYLFYFKKWFNLSECVLLLVTYACLH